MGKTRLIIPESELRKFEQELTKEQKTMTEQVTDGMIDLAYDIDRDAKQKITDDEHIVTGRLWASIHVEHERLKNYKYSDNEGNTYNGSLGLQVDIGEVYVGTNVEYGDKIENKDSFLRDSWNKNIGNLVSKIKKHVK